MDPVGSRGRRAPQPVAMCSHRVEQFQGNSISCWGLWASPSHAEALETPGWENGAFKFPTTQ